MKLCLICTCVMVCHAAALRIPNATADHAEKLRQLSTIAAEADSIPSVIADFMNSVKSVLPDLYNGVRKDMSDDDLKRRIALIKRHSKYGGMEPEEYFHFMSYVRDHAPQRLLVWGIGFDSVLLNLLNEGGQTLFLEMDADWVKKTDAADLNYYSYHDSEFHTRVDHWADFVKHPHRANLKPLEGACWDTVLVDSPLGFAANNTGRGVPLYTAKVDIENCIAKQNYPAKQDVTVFVHDCAREAEDRFTKVFFGKPTTETGPKRLREFRLKKGRSTHK